MIIDSIGLNESYITSLKINENTFVYSIFDNTNYYNKIYIIIILMINLSINIY